MSVYRTYIDKQATLIKDNYTNNSKNPVFEIVRDENLYSRYIFSFDLTELRSEIETNQIPSGSVESHYVKFYNTVHYRDDLVGKSNIDGFYRDNNVAVQLFKFNEDFGKGVNFNYVYTTGLTNNLTETMEVPNWFYRDKYNTWNVPGIYSASTGTTIIETKNVLEGNENLIFDITNVITDTIYNTTGNTVNLGISYTDAFENTNTGNTSFILSYFSKYTQTYFEPFLETSFNNIITDNRENFYLDNVNKLYLYLTSNVDSVDKVEIIDYNGDLYQTISGNSINKLNKNVYYVELNIDSTDYPDAVNFEDSWTITKNGKQITNTQTFTLLTNENIFNQQVDAFENSEFSFSFYGIKQNENISQSNNKRRVQINTKRLYNSSIENEKVIDFIEYRIYVKQGDNQIEVCPFTKANTTFYSNYFDIYTNTLIPQTYYIDIQLSRNGIIKQYPNTLKFKIVSEKS